MNATPVYIDLSRLAMTTFVSGIQRVAREIVSRLLKDETLDVKLLRAADDRSFEVYGSLDFKNPLATLRPEDMRGGAVFFDIDSAWNMPMRRSWLFPILKARGVTVISHVYDLIPVTAPQYFYSETARQFLSWCSAVINGSDRVICNAKATKDTLSRLCGEWGLKAPRCDVVALGADFPKAGKGANPDARLLEKLPRRRYVLMVGTIEPRKNHALLLEAAGKLYDLGIRTVFAGRIGWNMDGFREKMQSHPLWEKGLFFAEGPNDATIHELYKNALCVVFPTKDEGFGLPVVEAFLRGTPVLCSDIPVLREVGGTLARYFDNTDADALVKAVKELSEDKEGYERLLGEIKAYRPKTWEQTAKEMGNILRKSVLRSENVPEPRVPELMAVLTARNEDLLRALPCWDAQMPFIKRVLVCCPERNVAELKERWRGRIELSFFTDEELLGGEELPRDHTTRNFFLRCLLMKKAPLPDYFLMSDDDCRPMTRISGEDFVEDGRMKGCYYYDLRHWKGTQGAYTSFDKSLFRTRDFLLKEGLPTLAYSSHRAQVICRPFYLEMLNEYPGIEHTGLDEWSSYFNYAVARHPECFSVRPYDVAGWPGAYTDWNLEVFPERFLFENFYDSLYDEGGLYEGLSRTYEPDTFARESMEKTARRLRELQKQKRCGEWLAAYYAVYQSLYHTPPQIELFRNEEGGFWMLPAWTVFPTDTLIRFPVEMDKAYSHRGTLTVSARNEHGRAIVPDTVIDLGALDAGVSPEWVFLTPKTPRAGMLTVLWEDGGEHVTADTVIRIVEGKGAAYEP